MALAQSGRSATYAPSEVLIKLTGPSFSADGGTHSVRGYADGTFITAERSTDMITHVSGADGEVGRVLSNDKSGVVTVTLLQTSLSNKAFSDAQFFDETTGTGAFALDVTDGFGGTIITGPSAWIMGPPSVGYSKGIETREWKIAVGHLGFIVTGNDAVQDAP